jgi:signal transduction histidine kinase
MTSKRPITAITGYIAGIRDGIADSPEKLEHYLATIQRKSDVMNNLIDNLFLLSRLDVDSIPFHFRTISLPGFLEDSCDELRQDYPDMTLLFQPPEIDIPRAGRRHAVAQGNRQYHLKRRQT